MPTGFVPVVLPLQSVGPTLYLINQSMTWTNAQTYCRATYNDLAPVKTAVDLQKMRDEAARQGVTSPIWVGLYNQFNSWRWSYTDVPISYRNWALYEPNNYNGGESCGQINTGGSWTDSACSALRYFICYNGESSIVHLDLDASGTCAPFVHFEHLMFVCLQLIIPEISALSASPFHQTGPTLRSTAESFTPTWPRRSTRQTTASSSNCRPSKETHGLDFSDTLGFGLWMAVKR